MKGGEEKGEREGEGGEGRARRVTDSGTGIYLPWFSCKVCPYRSIIACTPVAVLDVIPPPAPVPTATAPIKFSPDVVCLIPAPWGAIPLVLRRKVPSFF